MWFTISIRHCCDYCLTYRCGKCGFSCPNGSCYDYCSHRSNHNCASRLAAQRREQEEREERERRAQEERDRQERIQREQEEQQRLQRETEALKRQNQEQERLEQERITCEWMQQCEEQAPREREKQELQEQEEQEEQERLRREEQTQREREKKKLQEQEEQEEQERLRQRKQREREEQERLRQQREQEELKQRLKREQEARERQEQLRRIAREQKEKEAIKSTLQKALQQTSAIGDVEIDYASEEETDDSSKKVNHKETNAIQQEGLIGATEIDYGNLLHEAKVIDSRLLFETLNILPAEFIDDSHGDRAISIQVIESRYKQIEIAQTDTCKLIEAVCIKWRTTISEDHVWKPLTKRAIEKKNNRKNGAAIFDEEVKKSKKQLERLEKQNFYKLLQKECRCQLILQSVKHEAFLQLTKAARRILRKVSFYHRYGSNIYGLTVTLGEESTQNFLQEMYGTDTVVIPPFKSIGIVNNENTAYRCREQAPLVQAVWFQNINENALFHVQYSRGVLVICKYISQVQHLYNMLKKLHDSDKIFTYTGEEAGFEKDTINSGEIIIATNIVTFLPESFRVDIKSVGRTDSLFKQFCLLENKLLPSMDDSRNLHLWDRLVGWSDYSAYRLNPRKKSEKDAEWSKVKQNELGPAARSAPIKQQLEQIDSYDRRGLVADQVANELPAFPKRYTQNISIQFCSNHSSTVPVELLNKFKNGEKNRFQNNILEEHVWKRITKRAIEKKKSRKNGAAIFGEVVKKSKKRLERVEKRNLYKHLLKECRRQLILQSVKHKAFLQLSRSFRRNLCIVDCALLQPLLEYVHRGGKLQTRVVKRFPVIRWIEQSLIHELIVYPEGNVDEVLFEIFKKYWLDVKESFDWQDRRKLLYSLRAKQLTHGLTLLHINDILDMVLSLKSEGLNMICLEQDFWYRKLKRCWIRRRLVRRGCDEDTFDKLVEELGNLPWNSLMTNQFLEGIAEVQNQSLIRDLLFKVKNENVAHPVVMNIINQIHNEKHCVNNWIQELRYQILIKKIYELSPQVARDVDAKLGILLRKETADIIQHFIDTNKKLLGPNMSKFATILEHILTYQTTPDIWDQVYNAIKIEKNPEKWIGIIDKIIISSIFGKSYEYSVDELIEQTASKLTVVNPNNLKSKFNSVKVYSNATSSFSSSKFTEFNTVPSMMETNSEAFQRLTRKPVSTWKENEIRFWSNLVKFSPNQISTEEKIAVVTRAVELYHKFSPRPTQILSLLMLANPDQGRGRLAQINTGEGKSIIVAMLAVIHALKGVQVDVVTTSTELSIPEVRKQRPFFEMFDLTVDENSPDREKKAVYSCDVVYGTASDFQGDILRSEFLGNGCRGSRKFQVIIVDEVDSMLFDSRNHSVRLSDDNPGMFHLEVPLAVIWQHMHYIYNHMFGVNGKVYFIAEDFEAVGQQIKLYSGDDWETVSTEVDDKKKFISKHTEDHLRKLLRKLTNAERDEYDAYQELNLQILEKEEQISRKETEVLKDECVKMRKKLIELPWNNRYPVVDIPEHLRDFALNQISIWVKNAILAEWAYKRDAHYTVVHEKIVPVNFNETGDLQTNMVWSDGLTQFLQMKEGLKVDPEGISTNSISNVSFFQRYGSNIYGLTGTLGEESTQNFLKEMYGTDMVVIPPYKSIDIANNESSGYRCKELAPMVLSEENRWFQSVKANALYHAENGRGVLVICKYINQVRHLYNMLNDKNLHPNDKIFTYTGEEAAFEKKTIDSGEIIIATNIAGRGTDIKTTEEVEKNGGMCVLVTFLPESFRVEMQNVGRTAREGKRGMAQLIIHDGNNTSMEVLKKIRLVQETQATHIAVDDAKKMLIQDELFKHFCSVENKLLPSMDDSTNMHLWDWLKARWNVYSEDHLNSRKMSKKTAEWYKSRKNELEQVARSAVPIEELEKLDNNDLRDLVAQKVDNELPAFRKHYTQKVLSEFCSNHKSTVPIDLLNKFKNNEKFSPECSNLATRYKWGSCERKAVEETWGLWLKSKHFDDGQISNEDAINMFCSELAHDIEQRAQDDKLIQNPFFYVLKGNEELDAKKLEEAVVCFERAIALDPVFSVNARYNMARALLSYSENKGYKQQKALQQLKKARDLIKSVYRPNRLTFNTLIGQHACSEQTSQHVQHQLDILSQQEDFIEQACEVIETAQKNNNNVKLTLKDLKEIFSEAKETHKKAIREANGNGLKSLFTVEEKLPRPWRHIIAVALIGIAQIAAGCLIVMYTGGSLGSGLIAEGVADLIVAATAAIKGTFSWAAWATQKVISIAVSIVCSGIASIKQSIKTAKQAGTLGLGTVQQAGKGVLNTFKSGFKDISRTCFDIGKGIVRPQGGVQLAIKEVGLALGKGVVKECLTEAGKYCTDQLFMKNLENEISIRVSAALVRAFSENPLVVKALEEDERTGSSYWKQTFINEGMQLLKDKEINQCIDMLKKIAKGVADGSIPCAGSIIEYHGMVKCMSKLITYTDNFIEKFNKMVMDHEKSINEEIADFSNEISSQNSQPTFTTNQTDSDQVSVKEIGQAPDINCDSSEINVLEIREHTVYNSKAPTQKTTKLRSTYREGSTPETLAHAFKGAITAKLTTSIQENIVNPAVNRVTAHVTNDLFHSMGKSVDNLRKEIKTHRDLRSASNAMANAAGTDKTTQEVQELGEETKKRIDIITKDGHLHDTTSLALSAGVVKAPIHVYDEKGNLIDIVGSKLPGKPMKMTHFPPLKENPEGHIHPSDPNIPVTSSGKNSCALDAVMAQLSSAQRESQQIHNVDDLRKKMIEHTKANPNKAEVMFEKCVQLEQIASYRIIRGGKAPNNRKPLKRLSSGGKAPTKQKALDRSGEQASNRVDTQGFNRIKDRFGEEYDLQFESDSSTMDNARPDQVQRHHVIHKQFATHPVIISSNFKINGAFNMIVLPKSEKDRQELGTQRSPHCGPHPVELVGEINTELGKIKERNGIDNKPENTKDLLVLCARERKKVRCGERSLQKPKP